ncbi:39S ribosomal protein L54, mitochondrial [Lucilia cuprina]|uniref:39S ribosomal protein L54, mitochondrial n=1 Tax=Lucilia cuprina TaxID=7375 RepID=UPI001F059F49|nr:39S ribosomal protein L54, mitochondrial [Lucilia cuprina]
MSLINTLNMSLRLASQRCVQPSLIVRCFAAAPTPKKLKKLGKLGPIMEKKEIPVETDANKLVNYVCGSNILKTGEDIKLKPDSEYPDWLWTLNVDRIVPLEEMDQNTKQYWRRLRKMALRRNNQLAKLKKF